MAVDTVTHSVLILFFSGHSLIEFVIDVRNAFVSQHRVHSSTGDRLDERGNDAHSEKSLRVHMVSIRSLDPLSPLDMHPRS